MRSWRASASSPSARNRAGSAPVFSSGSRARGLAMGSRRRAHRESIGGRPRCAADEAAARTARGGRRRRAAGDARGRRRVPLGARGARDDVRQARPAALLAARLLPDVYIEELGKLVDDVPPVAVRRDRARDRRGRRPGARSSRIDERAARGRVDRPDPRRAAEGRPRGRRQGAPARDRGAGRGRPRAAALDGGVRRGALRDGAAAAARGARRGARDAPARRARTSSRRRTTPS